MHLFARRANRGTVLRARAEHEAAIAAKAGRAVNISLTLRNWAIGC